MARVKLDGSGQPIPTYDQAIIEGFARVFTGWNWACPTTLPDLHVRQHAPAARAGAGLQPGAADAAATPRSTRRGTKKVLVPGVTACPAGQTGEQDLQDALDNIFDASQRGAVHLRSS